MAAFLSSIYLWIKAVHLIAVIAWMAGIFYLPRLYVYHAERAAPGSELSETFKEMERKLLRVIMNPAMIAAWIFGLAMLAVIGWDGFWASGWLQAKIALVVVMTGFHHTLASWRKDFAADANRRPGRHYRIANEFPTLLMAAIVILAIVEPF